MCVYVLVCGKGVEIRLGVGCPCPPVRYDIVTPRHLFSISVSKIELAHTRKNKEQPTLALM